jgi:hypothetical protein
VELGEELQAAGFEDVEITTRERRRNSPTIELLTRRADPRGSAHA